MKFKINHLTGGRIAQLVGATVLAGALIAGTCVASAFAPMITTFLCGTGASFENEDFKQAAAQSDELCQSVAEEGIALLRNENNALPLSSKKVNVFGWNATDQGFLLSGIGSGSSTIVEEKKVTFLDALEEEGFEYNQDIIDLYNDYDSTNRPYSNARIPLVQPGIDAYSEDLLSAAEDFSDTAIVVISRIAGENVGEIPLTQQKSHGQATDTSRTYLEISTEEEDLLEMCRERFNKVIVIINSTNQMELGFLEDLDIDACLNVGIMGQSGALGIPRILAGDVTPSGRLTDIYSRDYFLDPTYSNYVRSGNYVTYLEDIYYGYKYYETAAYEGYLNYDEAVMYPFGYGLSYAEFEWDLVHLELDGEEITTFDNLTLEADSEVTLNFSVTNTSTEYKGSDVMQIYVTAPYYDGGIEKPYVKLVNFEKSVTLEPGQTQNNIKISFTAYDLASYDCYDANDNGAATWELDGGNYEIKFMENSHYLKEMVEGDQNILNFSVPNAGYIIDHDPFTGYEVENRFTGDNAIADLPIDGTTVYTGNNALTYFSRSDFEGTYPVSKGVPSNTGLVTKANNYQNAEFNQSEMPITDANNGHYLLTNPDGSKASLSDLRNNPGSLEFNYELIEAIGSDYDSKELNEIVDQLSANEACSIVEDSGFGSPAVESIGKQRLYDFDGPAGFNSNTQTGINSGEWTAFPNQVLIGQTFSKRIAKQIGLSMGAEGVLTGLQGWYAPVTNLHRSPFNGRNYEMYSEDPVLTGYLAAETVDGAKANGVYCFVKHFGLTEPGNNSRNLNTWVTEQNLRENYFKAFEIPVKEGGAVAIMSSFSSIGAVWSGANNGANIEILRNEWGFRGTIITDWSDGGGNMNPHAGVRGGNDIWLNPNVGNNANPLSRTNATEVYCAKQAAKNVIYTYCNTVTYNRNYDHSQDEIKAEVGTVSIEAPFAWWIPLLAGIDVLGIGGALVWAGLTLFLPSKKNEVVNEGDSE